MAKFYDKQKYYRAAVIYYNEVIRQQPGSRKAITPRNGSTLRAKVGDAALQPALTTAEAAKKRGMRVKHGWLKVDRQSRVRQITKLRCGTGDRCLLPPGFTRTRHHNCTCTPIGSTEHEREPDRLPPRDAALSRSVRPTGAVKASFAAVFACVTLGCLGYHVGPVKPYYLLDVHTIAILTFKTAPLSRASKYWPPIQSFINSNKMTFQAASDGTRGTLTPS